MPVDRLSVADLSERSKLRFEGPQALWFLDQLVTNRVEDLLPGTGQEALLLTPNGRITSHLRILRRRSADPDPDVLADAPPGHAAQLLDFFGMRVFATKVKISDFSGDFAILRVMGSDAVDAAGKALGAEIPVSEEGENCEIASDGRQAFAVRVLMPAPGIDLWIPPAWKAGVISELTAAGAQVLSEDEYDSLRVTAGVPVLGVDFDEHYLPQEAAFERSVHFAKGCYLGQEAVAMAQRGRIKRRLRHVEFDGPAIAGKVLYEGQDSGAVTSVGMTGGKSFGIATVKTTVAAGDRVQVVSPAGEQEEPAEPGAGAVIRELPGTTYGPRVPSARELRERLRGG